MWTVSIKLHLSIAAGHRRSHGVVVASQDLDRRPLLIFSRSKYLCELQTLIGLADCNFRRRLNSLCELRHSFSPEFLLRDTTP
jgi:hypothetical protein